MPIANATTATSLANTILSEVIDRQMRFNVDTPSVYNAVAHMPPTLVNSKRWKVPRFARFGEAPPATEGVEVVAQELDPSDDFVDTALRATSGFLGEWGEELSTVSAVPALVQALMQSTDLTFDNLVLALVSAMTNSVGDSTTENDGSNFVAVTSAFRATAKESAFMPVMVMSESAKKDLNNDLMNSGGSIYASVLGPQLHNAIAGPNQGAWAPFGGFMITSTDKLPTVAGGKGSFIAHISELEYALALVFSLAVKISPEIKPSRLGMFLVARFAVGAGIADQDRCHRFITRN